MRWIVLPFLAAVASGCGEEARGSAAPTKTIRGSVPALAREAARLGAPACGTRAEGAGPPSGFLVLTGQQCLACIEAPYAARRLSRSSAHRETLAILAPRADSAAGRRAPTRRR